VLIGGSVLETASGSPRGPILVVDDDDAVRGALDAALSGEGYEVLTARDGSAALEVAATHPLALILLDIRMPGMSGPEFAQAYRRVPGPRAPTVVLSAAGDAGAWARIIGAQAHLGKPFDLDELLRLVERYAGRAARVD
jgi:CheY-like chemotaxis protein